MPPTSSESQRGRKPVTRQNSPTTNEAETQQQASVYEQGSASGDPPPNPMQEMESRITRMLEGFTTRIQEDLAIVRVETIESRAELRVLRESQDATLARVTNLEEESRATLSMMTRDPNGGPNGEKDNQGESNNDKTGDNEEPENRTESHPSGKSRSGATKNSAGDRPGGGQTTVEKGEKEKKTEDRTSQRGHGKLPKAKEGSKEHQPQPKSKGSSNVSKKPTQSKRQADGPSFPDPDPSDSDSDRDSDNDEERRRDKGYEREEGNSDDDEVEPVSAAEKILSDREPRKGARYMSIKETVPRSSALKEALSYRSYRLWDTTQTVSEKIRSKLANLAKRMKSHIPDDQRFTGDDPVSVISFLEDFKVGCNHNCIPEGAAKHLFQYFLLGVARTALRQHLKTAGPEHDSYCGAVHFLLTTYATEECVQTESRKIFFMQQKSGEGELAFSRRLQSQAERLGSAFPSESMITAFINGIPENIRSYIAQVAPEATTYAQITMAADSAGRVLRARASAAQPTMNAVPSLLRRGPPGSQGPRPAYTAIVAPPTSENWGTAAAPLPPGADPRRRMSCFLCSQDHLLHDCPNLNPEQKKSAYQAHQRYLARRTEGGQPMFYKGGGFTRNEPSYVVQEEASENDIEEIVEPHGPTGTDAQENE